MVLLPFLLQMEIHTNLFPIVQATCHCFCILPVLTWWVLGCSHHGSESVFIHFCDWGIVLTSPGTHVSTIGWSELEVRVSIAAFLSPWGAHVSCFSANTTRYRWHSHMLMPRRGLVLATRRRRGPALKRKRPSPRPRRLSCPSPFGFRLGVVG